MPERLGQHFLTNITLLNTIAEKAVIDSSHIIIEVGPGHGELTSYLLARLDIKKGGQLIAIEKDEELYRSLAIKYAEEIQKKKLILIHGDVLRVLPNLVTTLKEKLYTLVGNIPYYLTGHLLRIIGDHPHKPARTLFLIQKEVAERMCALPPHMNLLSASIHYWAHPELLLYVPAHDFSPPPEVESAVILLTPRKDQPLVTHDLYYPFIKALFKQPRKTIFNNLSESFKIPKKELELLLASFNIKESTRAQNLDQNTIELMARKFIKEERHLSRYS